MKIGNSSSAYLPRGLYLILALLLSSCSTCSRNRALSEINKLRDSMEATIEGEMLRAQQREARRERLEIMIDSITTKNFTYENQVFDGVLMHKTWNNNPDLDRNGLMAVVYESTGGIVLVSTLPEIHGELHNRVEVEIAGTGVVYAADSNYSYPLTAPDGLNVLPVPNAKGEVLYILEEQALDMIAFIAANPAEEITVRAYCNDEVYASYTLSEDDKNAIIEAYRLSLLIKELREIEAQDVEFDD